MKLVIEALKRQIRLEEAAIAANKIERDSRKQLPGWKGSPMHPERPEYIEELKKAISILESEDSEAVELLQVILKSKEASLDVLLKNPNIENHWLRLMLGAEVRSLREQIFKSKR